MEHVIPTAENALDVIADLESQSAPDGVTDDIWEKLTAELVRELAERASGKLVNTPPRGAGGAAELGYLPATTSLQWLYVSPGDYDQNGVVSVSDLTPLGVHFGEISAGGAGRQFDPTTELWVIDGDCNGVIDLGDITPIGANFGTTVEGYRVYFSEYEDDVPATPDSTNGPDSIGLEFLPIWTGSASAGRLRFTHKIDPTLIPTYYWVRPYHGIDEGSASNSVNVSSSAPLAMLEAGVIEGVAPLHVTFDASGSIDPDGFITRYDYDFDGDGTWNAYDAASQITHIYFDPGVYTALLRVTDNDFAQDTAILDITVTVPGNEPPVASLSADVTDGDAPLHVYFDAQDSVDADGEIVKYEWDFEGTGTYIATGNDPTIDYTYDIGYYTAQLRVTDDRGDTDTATLEIKAHGWVFVDIGSGDNPSLAVVNGNPAISYTGSTEALCFAWSTTSTGKESADWNSVVVDSSQIGTRTTLVAVHGNPAISYLDRANQTLKYARSSTSTGSNSADWQIVTVDDVGEYEYAKSSQYMAAVAGKAAISYYDNIDHDLKYVRTTTMTGGDPADWAQIVTVDSTGDVGSHCSLAVVAENPAISYHDVDGHGLKYARSTTSHGDSTADWQAVTVYSNTFGTGLYTSLAVVDGNPAISFYDANFNDLKYARATTSTGVIAGWPAVMVYNGTSSFGYTSLLVANGNPAISFGSSLGLQYVRATTSAGLSTGDWTDTAILDTSTLGHRPNSLCSVSGQVAISYRTTSGVKYAIRF